MSVIADEIREKFYEWKNRCVELELYDMSPCECSPFNIDGFWIYNYLFPEILLICEDELKEDYLEIDIDNHAESFDEYVSLYYCATPGNLIFYPCWVCSEEQVLRIMSEVIGI